MENCPTALFVIFQRITCLNWIQPILKFAQEDNWEYFHDVFQGFFKPGNTNDDQKIFKAK